MVVVAFVPDGKLHGRRRRVVERDLVGGRRVKFEEDAGFGAAGLMVATWDSGAGGNGRRKMEWLVSVDVAVPVPATAGDGSRFVKVLPPDGGMGSRAVAGWGWVPAAGGEDELLFPRGAEVVEVEDLNGEWCHGYYMGEGGLFPAPYVRFAER